MSINRRELLKLISSVVAMLAVRKSFAAAPQLRKEINTLSAPELASFREGVKAMKDVTDKTDFTSRLYQRGVHLAPISEAVGVPDANIYWNQCKHSHPHFFSWHRWYVLFFEEIMRKMTGDSKLTVPYWDYFVDSRLPSAFRSQTVGGVDNPLYMDRAIGMNDGSGFVSGLNLNSFSQIGFALFSSSFESNPHGAVHNQVGGVMPFVDSAALDPIFWLHHCNVDRLWTIWLKQGGGRTNRSDSGWLNQTFPFKTVSGPRTVAAGDALTPESLGYTYEPSNLIIQNVINIERTKLIALLQVLKNGFKFSVIPKFPPKPGPDPGPWHELFTMKGVALDGHPAVGIFGLNKDDVKSLRSVIGDPNVDVAIRFNKISVTKLGSAGGFSIQAVLIPSATQLKLGELKVAADVGSFGSFEASIMSQAHADHAVHSPPIFPIPFDQRKDLAASMKDDPALVFLRRGLVDKEGHPLKFDPNQELMSIESISIDVAKRG